MTRSRWHLTHQGFPDDPAAAVGMPSTYGARRDAHGLDVDDGIEHRMDEACHGTDPEMAGGGRQRAAGAVQRQGGASVRSERR
jgi:hypothetical protein